MRSQKHESGLDRLEREANDEFRLLDDLGPREFSSEHLLELRGRAYERLRRFERLQRLNWMVLASGLGWLMLGLATAFYGYFLLARVAFALVFVTTAAFVAGLWMLQWKFESRGELEGSIRLIEDELRRRAGKKRAL